MESQPTVTQDRHIVFFDSFLLPRFYQIYFCNVSSATSSKFNNISNDTRRSRTSFFIALGVIIIASNPFELFRLFFILLKTFYWNANMIMLLSFWRNFQNWLNTCSHKFLTALGLSDVFFFTYSLWRKLLEWWEHLT